MKKTIGYYLWKKQVVNNKGKISKRKIAMFPTRYLCWTMTSYSVYECACNNELLLLLERKINVAFPFAISLFFIKKKNEYN